MSNKSDGNQIRYVFIYSESHKRYGLFRDLENRDNVRIIIPKENKPKNKIISLIKKIHISGTITKYINFPGKYIWYKKDNIELTSTEEYCIIFDDLALKAYSQKELNSICNLPNARCVLLLLNSMNSEITKLNGVKSKILKTKWDSVYTFDSDDIIRYNFKSINYCYFSRHDICEQKLKTDIYYVGALYKDRKQQILEVYKYLIDSKVIAEFHLQKIGIDRYLKLPYSKTIHYFKGKDALLSYERILEGDLRSKVILEIVQDNQSGPTLRYFEAVVYNRKLLTNNCKITKFPYYDGRFMRIFDKLDDIDIEWIKNDVEVNYGYSGDFSPLNLLKLVLG